jgi:hypothetical protein
MRPAPLALAALLIVLGGALSPAAAHRLDEYLQATRVSVETERVVVELDLTPGANIAQQVFARIDADGNRQLSDVEQQRYAAAAIAALRLAVDDHTLTARLTTQHFPSFDDMMAGTGTIRLRAEAPASTGIGRHRLVYLNSHAADGSVYLANALMPTDARVSLGPPARDPLQKGLAFDYVVAPQPAWTRIGWLFSATAIVGVLIVARRETRR